jgi:hypothetical protein
MLAKGSSRTYSGLRLRTAELGSRPKSEKGKAREGDATRRVVFSIFSLFCLDVSFPDCRYASKEKMRRFG